MFGVQGPGRCHGLLLPLIQWFWRLALQWPRYCKGSRGHAQKKHKGKEEVMIKKWEEEEEKGGGKRYEGGRKTIAAAAIAKAAGAESLLE